MSSLTEDKINDKKDTVDDDTENLLPDEKSDSKETIDISSDSTDEVIIIDVRKGKEREEETDKSEPTDRQSNFAVNEPKNGDTPSSQETDKKDDNTDTGPPKKVPGKWTSKFPFPLPKLGEPGGLDDPYRRRMNGATTKKYLTLLHEGKSREEARDMALAHRAHIALLRRQNEEGIIPPEIQDPKRQCTELNKVDNCNDITEVNRFSDVTPN